jgi:hypothetical protein
MKTYSNIFLEGKEQCVKILRVENSLSTDIELGKHVMTIFYIINISCIPNFWPNFLGRGELKRYLIRVMSSKVRCRSVATPVWFLSEREQCQCIAAVKQHCIVSSLSVSCNVAARLSFCVMRVLSVQKLLVEKPRQNSPGRINFVCSYLTSFLYSLPLFVPVPYFYRIIFPSLLFQHFC